MQEGREGSYSGRAVMDDCCSSCCIYIVYIIYYLLNELFVDV